MSFNTIEVLRHMRRLAKSYPTIVVEENYKLNTVKHEISNNINDLNDSISNIKSDKSADNKHSITGELRVDIGALDRCRREL